MRDEFLLDPDLVFLNHGSFGACPRPVFESYQRWQRELERNPVEFLGRRSAELLYESRRALAEHLGARVADLVYIPNATTGVNIVAQSIGLQAGDEILSTDHEYGACDNAWRFVAERSGARLVRARIELPFSAARFVDTVWAGVSARTRVISVSHITSTTALVFPIEALVERARAEHIAVVVDGAHAPGQLALDLDRLGADFYVGNCHKWLCAPKGVGFLHARAERHAELDAPVRSWGYGEGLGGHSGFEAFLGSTLFERRMQWQGTRDISGFLAVPAALEFLARHDWPAVRARCHRDAVALYERHLERCGATPPARAQDFAQMVLLPVPSGAAPTLRERLFREHRIEVPVTAHGPDQFLRVSVQGYNRAADLTALEDALEDILGPRP